MIERRGIITNKSFINIEFGHSKKEWEENFANGDLWSFTLDDLLLGAVEPNENCLYWSINGRLYETTYEPIDAYFMAYRNWFNEFYIEYDDAYETCGFSMYHQTITIEKRDRFVLVWEKSNLVCVADFEVTKLKNL